MGTTVQWSPGISLGQLRANLAVNGRGLYIGTDGRRLIWAGPQQSMLVLGPPRSGKTSSLVVPNVLAAPGPALVTSNKANVLHATLASRAHLGRCWLLGPTGTTEPPPGAQLVRGRADPGVARAAAPPADLEQLDLAVLVPTSHPCLLPRPPAQWSPPGGGRRPTGQLRNQPIAALGAGQARYSPAGVSGGEEPTKIQAPGPSLVRARPSSLRAWSSPALPAFELDRSPVMAWQGTRRASTTPLGARKMPMPASLRRAGGTSIRKST